MDLTQRVPIVVGQWCASPRTATVSCTIDGDTVDVNGCGEDVGERLRLLGINAPEIAHGDSPAECYGNEAADFLDDLVTNHTVHLDFDQECTDVYGRTLAWVTLKGDDPSVASLLTDLDNLGMNSDGSYEVLVNELMVRAGYAVLYDESFAQQVRYYDEIERAQADAEAEGRGLWGACE